MPGAAELGWLLEEPFGDLVLDAMRDARRDLDGLMVEARLTDPGERLTAWLAPEGIHVALLNLFHDLEEILMWLGDRRCPKWAGARAAASEALSDAKSGLRIFDGRVTVERGHPLQVAERMEGLVGLYRQVVENQVALARELGVADAIERPVPGLDPMTLLVPMAQLLSALEVEVAGEGR
jgi:hypothetical protein